MKYAIFIISIVLFAPSTLPAASFNEHFLLPPATEANRSEWLQSARQLHDTSRKSIEQKAGPNAWSIYTREDLKWMITDFTCRMCMMFDAEFYDHSSGEYLVDSLLADSVNEFGGYDSIVLWHAYPRLGFDQRNQYDFYRDMPGGLAGIRKLVQRCHSKNVRVFIDYNPWDTGTRREAKGDYEMLAEIIAAIDADGIFLDTLSEGSEKLRFELDKAKLGVALVSEGHPPQEQLAVCSGSWGQWLDEPGKPAILKLKWIESRHMQYQIRRWDKDRNGEIQTAFFNGSGMLIWENIFGSYNPWNMQDRLDWKKANLILHYFSDIFANTNSEPYYPSKNPQVFINHWNKDGMDIFIFINKGKILNNEILFEIPFESEMKFYDLWNGKIIEPNVVRNKALIICPIDKIGCVVASKNEQSELFKQIKSMEGKPSADLRNFSKQIVNADFVASTPIAKQTEKPLGMVFVPGIEKTFYIEHELRECGCYPDSQKQGNPGVDENLIHKTMRHKIGPITIKPFFIDEAQVTNAEYKRFLDSSGYKPKYKENFLKHWPDGNMPPELADHPVVYVDIDDARAYAKWAGKRLPTEFEWQLAAQGTGNLKWPWGNNFDPNKCNSTGSHTIPARSLPEGKSPYGCYNMTGNVWEWTESCRDDGHTRFVMVRGGSYFNAQGSIWYAKGGPQPCGYHAKFIRMWPGLDRCSTVGFRCVVDSE